MNPSPLPYCWKVCLGFVWPEQLPPFLTRRALVAHGRDWFALAFRSKLRVDQLTLQPIFLLAEVWMKAATWDVPGRSQM